MREVGIKTRFTILIWGGLFIVGIIVLSTSLYAIFANIRKAEQSVASLQLNLFADRLRSEALQITRLTADWSKWDDSYQYIQDGNKAYEKSNLSGTYIQDIKLNIIAFLKLDGTVVYYKTYFAENPDAPNDEKYLNAIKKNQELLQKARKENSHGLLWLENVLFAFTINPIIPTDGLREANGYLIFARRVTNSYTERVSDQDFKINILPYDKNQQLLQKRLEVVSEKEILARTALENPLGKNEVVFEVHLNREIYASGIRNLGWIIGMFGVVSIIIGAFVFYLSRYFKNYFTQRVENLYREIDTIRSEHNSSLRLHVDGADEISHLANRINGMLISIDEGEKKLAKEKLETERLRSLHAESQVKMMLSVADRFNSPLTGLENAWRHIEKNLETATHHSPNLPHSGDGELEFVKERLKRYKNTVNDCISSFHDVSKELNSWRESNLEIDHTELTITKEKSVL